MKDSKYGPDSQKANQEHLFSEMNGDLPVPPSSQTRPQNDTDLSLGALDKKGRLIH